MKKNKNTILLVGLIGIIVLAYYMGGVPFLGALVLFEEGNEIVFSAAYTEITKIYNATTSQNETISYPADTDEERFLTLQSKYITNAYIRLYGTPGISNAKMIVVYKTETIDPIAGTITTSTYEEPIWTQPVPFAEIEEIDMTSALSNHKEGDVITFKFHSDTSGSLIVATFNVDWGPTQQQIDLCNTTGGTFIESNIRCDCSEDAVGFTWEGGCEMPTPSVPSAPSAPTAPSPTSTTSLQAVSPEYNTLKIVILVVILGLIIYYFGFERGKKGFFKKI